ncbi:response regulator [Novosphingobium sp. BW1]|uniref:response regulator n=1 Tax=Novosphingobium sp. BW1 TaxID=2592621 RepID=UPI00139691CA
MEHDILTIDGDPIMTQILIEQLAPLTRPRVAANASEAMKQITQRVPDLILLDTELPGTHGIDLCRALHDDARLAHVPIIFLTAQTGEAFAIEGLESGAVDFISKPPHDLQAPPWSGFARPRENAVGTGPSDPRARAAQPDRSANRAHQPTPL